jgi:hypothetical protein
VDQSGRQPDQVAVPLDGGCLDHGDLVLTKALADEVETTGE